MATSNADLQDLITKAFPAFPMPAVTLHQWKLGDVTMHRKISESEWFEAHNKDANIPWTRVDDKSIVGCEAALAHFDAEAFIYYLPAFLSFVIKNLNADSTHKSASVVFSIIYSVTTFSDYNLKRLGKLDFAQKHAVLEFLKFIKSSSKREALVSRVEKALDYFSVN